jgi:CheY-like chemotaxis protein/anti-sigma regulatory factor (Ser/Thr protein kinase)
VDVDAVRMAQVLSNLISNAAKYTDPGGSIQVTGRREGDEIVIEVADNGRGIADEARKRIFEPFVQEEPRSSGLGVGLALVKRLVELHDGSVAVASGGEGAGSTFTVRLPIGEGPEGRRVTSLMPEPMPAHLRVVVVEDSPDVREALGELLELWGHEVHLAATGEEGVALTLACKPDTALVDLGLPDMDGCEVARRVRKANGGHQPRLVALTGFGRASDRRRALEAGFDAHLVKPPNVNELQRVLAGDVATSS